MLVLSSSHPSLETKAAVEQRGIVVRKPMPSDARPSIQVVDLRDHGRGTVLSQPLVRAIELVIGRRAGVLLFLNRKGYAGALVCRDCGHVPRCPACRVALMYSRQAGRLLCSYCGDVVPIPETCASCSGSRMRLIGEGTERVEEDAKRLFPHAAVIRLDGDTMRKPAQAEVLWRRVEQGEWDIIVGTQLAAAARVSPDDGPRWDCTGGCGTQRTGFPIRRTYVSYASRCGQSRRSGRGWRPGYRADLSVISSCDSGCGSERRIRLPLGGTVLSDCIGVSACGLSDCSPRIRDQRENGSRRCHGLGGSTHRLLLHRP